MNIANTMKLTSRAAIAAAVLLAGTAALQLASGEADPKNVLTGEAAFASFTNVKPGVWRHITVDSLPKPGATPSSTSRAEIVPRPADAWPQALPDSRSTLRHRPAPSLVSSAALPTATSWSSNLTIAAGQTSASVCFGTTSVRGHA